jgi:hypothetical protein
VKKIREQVAMASKELEKIDNDQLRKNVGKYVLDYVLDRIDLSDFMNLCHELSNAIESKDVHDIIQSFEHAGVFVMYEPSVYYVRIMYHGQIPMDSTQLFILQQGSFHQSTDIEFSMMSSIPKVVQRNGKLPMSIRDMAGYMEFTLSGNVVTGVQFKIVGENAKSNGFVCGTGVWTRDVYAENIKAIDDNAYVDDKTYTKPQLCFIYELLLRMTKGKFSRPFDTLCIMNKSKDAVAAQKALAKPKVKKQRAVKSTKTKAK